jgi:serine/threonine-protein kinase
VHRDVSPQNIIVGADGVARVLDFGVAKAAGRIQTTREGQLKGKIAYMAPEQYHGEVSRLTDVFAGSVVLWEAIVGDKLFSGNEGEIVAKILHRPIPSPRERRSDLSPAVEEIVMRGLARDPKDRFATALEMSDALVQALPPASSAEVGAWVTSLAAETLRDRQALIREMETEPHISPKRLVPATPPDAATKTDLASDKLIKIKSHARTWRLSILGLLVIAIAGLSLRRVRHDSNIPVSSANDAAIAPTATPAQSEQPSAEASAWPRPVPPPTSTNSSATAAPARPVVPAATVHHVTVKAATSATAVAPDHI